MKAKKDSGMKAVRSAGGAVDRAPKLLRLSVAEQVRARNERLAAPGAGKPAGETPAPPHFKRPPAGAGSGRAAVPVGGSPTGTGGSPVLPTVQGLRTKASLTQESGQAKIALALWESMGLPKAVLQYQFHPARKWRFDFAFHFTAENAENAKTLGKADQQVRPSGSTLNSQLSTGIAIEVQGAVFGTGPKCQACGQRRAGRHGGGRALLAEHEKWRAAAELGWRILPVSPQELLTSGFAEQLKRILTAESAESTKNF